MLSGSYEEAGDGGRFALEPGCVLYHASFDAHLDRLSAGPVELLNIPMDIATNQRFGTVRDPDAIVRAAESSTEDAVALLAEQVFPRESGRDGWADSLAAHLIGNPFALLGDWAASHGLTRSRLSRGFRQVFGVSPTAFRARARGRRAWAEVMTTSETLAGIAANLNFSDQAHMTRTVKSITLETPGSWRQRKWIQDAGQLRAYTAT